MERGDRSVPDWRDAAHYAPLLAADRAILAWEWVRRDPAYRRAAANAGTTGDPAAAETWGLHRFEDPGLAAPFARPMWTAAAFDAVLQAEPIPASGRDAVSLTRFGPLLTETSGRDRRHILLSDGWRVIRLDLVGPPAVHRWSRLRFAIAGPPLAVPILALRRVDSLLRAGRFVHALHRPEPRARRQVLLLRTADALAGGAAQRVIAAGLFDPAVARIAWREERPDLRLQVQRLVRDARANLAGAYRALLRRR